MALKEDKPMIWRHGLFCTALLLILSTSVIADEPQPEALPVPRTAAPVIVLPPGAPEPLPYMRQDRYAIWQYYGVDRQGTWRPRVIYAPYGSYYLYNGQPYLWGE